jgi:hypothetical protein
LSFLSGIFHFVKDNYFRTSSSSSDDEYDSDDSTGKHRHAAAGNGPHKSQPLVGPLINTAAVATAVAAGTSASIQSSSSNGIRYE